MSDCSPRYTNGKAKGVQSIEFKRGDTLVLFMKAVDENNEGVDLTGYDIAAQMRNTSGELVLTFAVTLVPADLVQGVYELWAPDNVTPEVGSYKVDVQYGVPFNGQTLKRSTETFWIEIVEDVTRT